MSNTHPYRSSGGSLRPRFRVVHVPTGLERHDPPRVQWVIDNLEDDERVVSVYPVFVDLNHGTLLMDALVEVLPSRDVKPSLPPPMSKRDADDDSNDLDGDPFPLVISKVSLTEGDDE